MSLSLIILFFHSLSWNYGKIIYFHVYANNGKKKKKMFQRFLAVKFLDFDACFAILVYPGLRLRKY